MLAIEVRAFHTCSHLYRKALFRCRCPALCRANMKSSVLSRAMVLDFADCATISAVNENDLEGRLMAANGSLIQTPSRLLWERHGSGDSYIGDEASACLLWTISSDGSCSGREKPVEGWGTQCLRTLGWQGLYSPPSPPPCPGWILTPTIQPLPPTAPRRTAFPLLSPGHVFVALVSQYHW